MAEAKVYDCIVVGAGASGLAAALAVKDSGQSVCLVEARDRCGGRIFDAWGAGFISRSQHKVKKYLARYGLFNLQPIYSGGRTLVESVREGNVLSDKPSPRLLRYLLRGINVAATIDELGMDINVKEPWNSKDAEWLDATSVQDYLDALLGKQDELVKGAILAAIEPSFGTNIRLSDISMLWFLSYVKRTGSLAEIFFYGQELKLVETFQALIDRMVEDLGQDNVHCNAVVQKIDTRKSLATVEVTTTRGVFYGKRCIVALQPTLYHALNVVADVAHAWEEKLALCHKFRSVERSYSKIMLTYETPWWRQEGFSGQILTECGPVSWFVDYSTDGKEKYVLVGMVTHSEATRTWNAATKSERKDLVLAQLKRVYNEVNLKDVSVIDQVAHYEEMRWNQEEFTDGAVLSLPPDSINQWKTINSSVDGKLFFAGTEVATVWTGYVDGALQAGERAANSLLQSLDIPSDYKDIESDNDEFKKLGFGSKKTVVPWIVRKLFAENLSETRKRIE